MSPVLISTELELLGTIPPTQFDGSLQFPDPDDSIIWEIADNFKKINVIKILKCLIIIDNVKDKIIIKY